MSKLDEIRERLEAASSAPWKWHGEDYRGGWGWQLLVNAEGQGLIVGTDCGELRAYEPVDASHVVTFLNVFQPDAHLIAHAPTDIAYLLEEVERLRGVVTTATIACGAIGLEAAEDIDRWRDNWGEVIRDEVLDATQRVRAVLEGKT